TIVRYQLVTYTTLFRSNSSEVRYTVIFSLCRTRPLAGADDCADDWSEDWTEDWTEDSDCSGDDVGPKISSAPGIFTRLGIAATRSEEHTSELQSRFDIV